MRPIGAASRAVTLATIFQYRSSRRFHRWQFWLDAGSRYGRVVVRQLCTVRRYFYKIDSVALGRRKTI